MKTISAFLFTARGPAGPPGVSPAEQIVIVAGEVPTGDIDGINDVFVSSADFNVLWVFRNGLRMKQDLDYTITGLNEITFALPPQTGDTLLIDYVSFLT